ncbi:hypothetical protein V2O64_20720 [Verrucomicrobiaceae bacterium 227]
MTSLRLRFKKQAFAFITYLAGILTTFWKHRGAQALVLGLLISLILHFIIKDHLGMIGGKIWLVSALFYALPLRIITCFAWITVIVTFLQKRLRLYRRGFQHPLRLNSHAGPSTKL